MTKLFFRKWHRRLGVASVFMVLWLAFSGVLINHGDRLALNSTEINTKLINKLYGLEAKPELPLGFSINESFIFCFNNTLYQNDQLIGDCGGSVMSVTEIDNQLLVLSDLGISILDTKRELDSQLQFIEFIQFNELRDFSQFGDVKITQLLQSYDAGNIEKSLVLKGEFNQQAEANYFSFNLISFELKALEALPENITSQAINLKILPSEYRSMLNSLNNSADGYPGISLERILLDAHSGRLFGSFGVLVVDFFALAFVILALSGLWIFIKRT